MSDDIAWALFAAAAVGGNNACGTNGIGDSSFLTSSIAADDAAEQADALLIALRKRFPRDAHDTPAG